MHQRNRFFVQKQRYVNHVKTSEALNLLMTNFRLTCQRVFAQSCLIKKLKTFVPMQPN